MPVYTTSNLKPMKSHIPKKLYIISRLYCERKSKLSLVAWNTWMSLEKLSSQFYGTLPSYWLQNRQIQIYIDLTDLNCYTTRSKITLPDVETTLDLIKLSCFFTKLEAHNRFWQICLREESAKLTIFITPFGRFHFAQLPFGIFSTLYFQLQIRKFLLG